jgi:hypothetical protein
MQPWCRRPSWPLVSLLNSATLGRMKDPLTREQLRAIQDRNPDSPDVRALLWEVKRLRAVVLRSHDYFRQSPTSSTARTLHESMLQQLEDEPAVKEQPKL